MPGPAGLLAVIAGRGALPRRIAEARAVAGLPYLLIVFPDCYEPWMADHPHQRHLFAAVLVQGQNLQLALAGLEDVPEDTGDRHDDQQGDQRDQRAA